MQLLDLPPEVFKEVIHRYVNAVGVVEAWNGRKNVCSKS
jgi:hypothetical protein